MKEDLQKEAPLSRECLVLYTRGKGRTEGQEVCLAMSSQHCQVNVWFKKMCLPSYGKK